MKKLLLIFATVLLVGSLFTSCSKDDDNGPSVVGVWKGYIYYKFTSNGNWYEYGSDSEYKAGNYRDSGKYTFDGKYLSKDGDFKQEIEFSEDGNKMKYNGILYYRIE